MPWTMKLLVIANRTVDSDEIRDAIVNRAVAGPVEITLIAPASSGAGSMRERRAATALRLDRAVQELRDVGVPVEGVVGDPDPMLAVQDAWDPRRYDEASALFSSPSGASACRIAGVLENCTSR